MDREVRQLQAMMQTHYGDEFRRKWQGFTPKEMAELWSRKFLMEGIHPSVVLRLGDSLNWPHPPTLPVVVDALNELQERMKREQAEQRGLKALPAPSMVADPSSPVVQAAREEIRRWLAAHVVTKA